MVSGAGDGEHGERGGRHPAPDGEGRLGALERRQLAGHRDLVRVVSVAGVAQLGRVAGRVPEKGGALHHGQHHGLAGAWLRAAGVDAQRTRTPGLPRIRGIVHSILRDRFHPIRLRIRPLSAR